MGETEQLQALARTLCRAGDPRSHQRWEKGDPDYVKLFDLGPEHIPVLIDIARGWPEDVDWLDDDILDAPVHAWRALGQLRAAEAVEPLLAMQNAMDNQENADWYLEDFHIVFGWIGPPAIPALVAYLADLRNTEFARLSTAHSLCEIAKRFPETRNEVVGALTRQLATSEPEVYSLNGFVIGFLARLGAVESAEVIERAFAAGIVDEMACGDWPMIHRELGVERAGLVSDPEHRPVWILEPPSPFLDYFPFGRERGRQQEKKEKAKRKQQAKAKKRNRKKR